MSRLMENTCSVDSPCLGPDSHAFAYASSPIPRHSSKCTKPSEVEEISTP